MTGLRQIFSLALITGIFIWLPSCSTEAAKKEEVKLPTLEGIATSEQGTAVLKQLETIGTGATPQQLQPIAKEFITAFLTEPLEVPKPDDGKGKK